MLFFAEHLYGFLVEPYAQAVKDDGTDRRLIFTALQETFLTYLKVSFFTAFFVTCPIYFDADLEIYCSWSL